MFTLYLFSCNSPALLEALVLEVEAVFQQALLQELGDIVEGNMHQHNTDDGSEHIEPSVQTESIETEHYRMTEQPYGQHNQQYSPTAADKAPAYERQTPDVSCCAFLHR